MSFGIRLQTLREQAGLSQTALAERAGMSVDSIQNWEQGRTQPRLDALPRLARALGVSIDSLVVNGTDENGGRKRPRGRPSKPKPEQAGAKRPRGRPRKGGE